MVALYEAVLGELGSGDGARVLDVGCGTGLFLRLARQRGAAVAGVDASAASIELARERLPEADLACEDPESLPFPDGSFDVVTAFDAFQRAADPGGALREAVRVSRPGGALVLAAWGRPDQCEAAAYVRAAGARLPLPPRPFALSGPGALAAFAAGAGVTAGERRQVPCVWSFPDEATLLGDAAGDDAATRAILAAVAPYRTSDGGYRLENVFHFVIAHP